MTAVAFIKADSEEKVTVSSTNDNDDDEKEDSSSSAFGIELDKGSEDSQSPSARAGAAANDPSEKEEQEDPFVILMSDSEENDSDNEHTPTSNAREVEDSSDESAQEVSFCSVGDLLLSSSHSTPEGRQQLQRTSGSDSASSASGMLSMPNLVSAGSSPADPRCSRRDVAIITGGVSALASVGEGRHKSPASLDCQTAGDGQAIQNLQVVENGREAARISRGRADLQSQAVHNSGSVEVGQSVQNGQAVPIGLAAKNNWAVRNIQAFTPLETSSPVANTR
jgi:hypothetical protein